MRSRNEDTHKHLTSTKIILNCLSLFMFSNKSKILIYGLEECISLKTQINEYGLDCLFKKLISPNMPLAPDTLPLFYCETWEMVKRIVQSEKYKSPQTSTQFGYILFFKKTHVSLQIFCNIFYVIKSYIFVKKNSKLSLSFFNLRGPTLTDHIYPIAAKKFKQPRSRTIKNFIKQFSKHFTLLINPITIIYEIENG